MISRRIPYALAAGVSLCLAACSGSSSSTQSAAPAPAAAAQQGPPFQLTATIKELMDSTVDPSADGLWDSVAVIYSKSGVEDKQPRTDEEWKAVRRNAITLMEATNLLIMDGRHAAPPGTQPNEGELSPSEIDQRIGANPAAFAQFAHGLREAGQKALTAIDSKNAAALMEAGGGIDEACEACHVTYWYPNQKIPTT
jgi:hypothetical protein